MVCKHCVSIVNCVVHKSNRCSLLHQHHLSLSRHCRQMASTTFRSWATLIQWLPPISSTSSRHLLFGLSLPLFSSLGVHSVVILAHLMLFILARCLTYCLFMLLISRRLSLQSLIVLLHSRSCLFLWCSIAIFPCFFGPLPASFPDILWGSMSPSRTS